MSNLEQSAGTLARAAEMMTDLQLSSFVHTSQRFEQFAHDYAEMLHSTPRVPDVPGAIESAGQLLISRIEDRLENASFGEPPIMAADKQRWKWGVWDFVLGATSVLITAVIVAILVANHKL